MGPDGCAADSYVYVLWLKAAGLVSDDNRLTWAATNVS